VVAAAILGLDRGVRDIAGIGLGVRQEFVAEIATTPREIDFIEIVPENWIRPQTRGLIDPCIERWPTVPHSIHLSIGGPDPMDLAFLAAMREITRKIRAPFYSDHVCYSKVHGIHTGELLPMPFSAEAIEHIAARAAEFRANMDVPLVLENPTYYSVMPGSTMGEAEFLTTLLAEADCGMLLDVNNVWVNARNHGYDAHAFIDRMPMDRVRQLHMAGHDYNEPLDTIVDTHGAAVRDEVWTLYRYTLKKAGRLIPTVIEWDNKLPPLAQVLDEVDKARAHAATALGS
jgi:uncharacterized protein (UPF0276 family)